MSDLFAARMTRCPIAHDTEAAAGVFLVFSDLSPEVAGLLSATAGCSPYLRGLMLREAAWLRGALVQSPEAVFAEVLGGLASGGPDTIGTALRQAKSRVALLVALADLGGVWQLEVVTGALTALADQAVEVSVRALVADEIRRGKLPGAVASDAATAGGLVVLAMGKMGAGELNYSSDIDLVCLFDQDRYPGVEAEARASFIRVVRRMTELLGKVTVGGYVFRTDLRLRPDAAVTPVCLSMAAAESYYESAGRTWERAAYIKARPCAGDLAAGERFLRTLIPFVWRKHLDFAAIQDAHDMRLRIRDHRRLHGPISVEGHNIKLGVGGIREIEFFTQTRQLIAGGRDPDLRDRTTVGALGALARKGWLPDTVAEELTTLYRAHREVEHRLQMVGDSQTHDLPATPEGIARIAAFCGQDEAAFRAGLIDRLTCTDRLTEDFFAPAAAEPVPELSDKARSIVAGWSRYPALRSERAQGIFRRLAPALLQRLNRARNPDEALVALDGFLAGLPGGVQIFSLFEANPSLVDLIIDIAATAPALARHLARNAAVLDAVIGGSFFAVWPGAEGLAADLSARLAEGTDYEGRLDAARRWNREWHFRIGVHHLRGLIDAFEAGRQYADLAGAVVAALWPVVVAAFEAKHGPQPGRGAVVLGMGSLGAGQLNAQSDVDLIVIYDAGGVEASVGPRPLATRAYFARLTQGLVTALTAPMAEGRLYDVDMRLRPSGRQGPVATSLPSFRSYQMGEAWTWEHLALTRARVLAGDTGLAGDVEALRCAVLAAKGPGAGVRADVAEMRARLEVARPEGDGWQARGGVGRLLDIELFAQMLALQAGDGSQVVGAQIGAGVRAGLVTRGQAETLIGTHDLCWRVQAATRLLSDKALDPATMGEGGRAFVLRETGSADMNDLRIRLADAAGLAGAVISAQLGR